MSAVIEEATDLSTGTRDLAFSQTHLLFQSFYALLFHFYFYAMPTGTFLLYLLYIANIPPVNTALLSNTELLLQSLSVSISHIQNTCVQLVTLI